MTHEDQVIRAFDIVLKDTLSADSSRGTWEITKQGRQWLEAQTE